ncbi:MAG TPA: hypothetical protein VF025_02370 [Gaiellaceae bacterium]
MSLLGFLGAGAAGAAPAPVYTVSCAVAGNTTAQYQHVKLSQVTFAWFASGTTFSSITVPITRKAPNGSAFSTTPIAGLDGINPASVTVTFTRADGSGPDQASMTCT